MADNVLATAIRLSAAQGTPIRIKAADVSGVYTLHGANSGLVAITIPGVVQADNQNELAPIAASDNGDGTYSPVISIV